MQDILKLRQTQRTNNTMKWLSYADKTALISGDRRISYGQLIDMVLKTGEKMSQFSRRGDRIAIFGANSPEWVLALYSIWNIHATVVPIDFMSTPEEVAYILDDCTPTVIWCDTKTKEKTQQALALMQKAHPAVMALESLVVKTNDARTDGEGVGESDDDELALIIYTSGTTGSPKGVMLTFRNLRSNTEACSTQIEVFIPDDRVMIILPLHHAYPLMASVVMPMSINATAVFAQDMTGEAILSAMKQNQATFIVGVPRLLELFRNSLMRKVQASLLGRIMYRVSVACHSLKVSRIIFKKVQDAFGGHMRYISSGGAANDPQVTRDFYALGFQLLEGYGMTETAPMISFTPPGRYKPGSPGKPIPCNEVKIADGEVLVRGNNVMKGYYNRPEETALAIDKDGWLHTGDLGYIDEDGFLFLTGRSKELIILGNGKNISPAELEQKLMDMSNGLFSECAVTEDGRNLVCIVVPDMEAIAAQGIVNIRQTIMDAVIEPYNESSPSYKRITDITIRNTPLPRTRLGKLRRHIIRQEMAAAARGETIHDDKNAKPAPETKTYRNLIACIEKIVGRPVKPDEHFELDLGMDSLGKMNLLSMISAELGVSLPVETLAKTPTARSLAEAIDAGTEGTAAAVPAPKRSLPQTGFTHGLYRSVSSAILHCISKLEISGKENIPDGPCIFAPNHQSSLDGFYLGAAMDAKRFHDTYFYAISKFVDGVVTGYIARHHNVVPMELNGDLRESIGLLEEALKSGKSVAIFPEGTRSMDGSLGEFYMMFAQLSLNAKAPIVPVLIDGAFDVLPRGKSLPSFGKTVKLSFLPPVTPSGDATAESLRNETFGKIKSALELSSKRSGNGTQAS